MVDAQQTLLAVMLDKQHTLVRGLSDEEMFHTGIGENLLHRVLLRLLKLDEHGGILGEENLHKVGLAVLQEPGGGELEAARGVGKQHLEHGGHQTSGRDIMHGQQLAPLDQLLHGVESSREAGGVFHRRSIRTDAVEGLGKRRAAKTQRVGGEIDIIEEGVLFVFQHRAHCAAHIASLAGSGYDDSAGGKHLVLAIFLGHRQGVLSGGDVDAEGAGEVRASLDSLVKGGILSGVLAGPHPVGRE